jgi:hypothetical protein
MMRKPYSISLNEKDLAIYKKVHEKTGYGVTEIFRKMLYSLEKVIDAPSPTVQAPPEQTNTEEE